MAYLLIGKYILSETEEKYAIRQSVVQNGSMYFGLHYFMPQLGCSAA
jgi:hypothetical protein